MSANKKQETKELAFTGERMIPPKNTGMALYYEHIVRYLFAGQLVRGKSVLDLGCGTGYGSFLLSNLGKAETVLGVDISKESVDYALTHYKNKRIDFQVGDVEQLKNIKPSSVDIIVSFELIEHINNQEKVIEEIKRVMRSTGKCLISTPNKYTYPDNNIYHKKELYPEDFKNFLKQYFKYVDFYHQCYEIAEVIKPESYSINVAKVLSDNYVKASGEFFTPPLNKNNSQYIIALCSDYPLAKLDTPIITATKIDRFDFTKGIELCDLLVQFNNIENQLKTIQSSKFYKLWQGYNLIKNFVGINRNHER